MACENFACTRLNICPLDIKQRIADGFGAALYVLGDPCTPFDFNQLVSAISPTSQLPVLFSSLRYRSHQLEDTSYPQLDVFVMNEYWFGLDVWGDDSLCARSGSRCYIFHAGTWYFPPLPTATFKSEPGVILSGTSSGDALLSVKGYPTRTLGSMPSAITNCQMSGDGLTYFVKTSTGWNQFDDINKDWIELEPNYPSSWLVSSFDGTTIVQTNSSLIPDEFHYKIGSDHTQADIANGSGSEVYAAALGDTIFVARGSAISTVGSLNVQTQIYTLPIGVVATGVWADNVTVWVRTTTGTWMSNDAGWTWTVLENEFAVGPGLFTKPGSDNIWRTSEEPFSVMVGFPLRLTNGGLLFSPSTGWRNGFEDKTMSSGYTELLSTTTAALSPNGLYLFTNEDGVITLYLNVWNSTRFADWCKVNNCKSGYANYCQRFGTIDPKCRTNTPDGQTPVLPTPTPSKDFPIWAIVAIVLGVLVLVIGIMYATLKKK